METDRYKSIFVFFALSLAALSIQASGTSMSVLVSTDSEFRFVCNFESELDRLPAAIDSGSAATLERIVQVAVPPGAEARIISAAGRFARPGSSYTATASGPESLAAVSRPVTIRGRSSVGVRVSPFGAGTVYGEVEISVGFDRVRPSLSLSRPNDPIFERVWSAALANYDAAATWPVIDRRSYQPGALGVAATNSLTQADQWYKVVVRRTGLVRITGSDLEAAGIILSGLTPGDIRIFNAGGLPNSIYNSDPRPQFEEISLMLIDGGDGSFDRADQVLFYGEAPSRWVFAAGAAPEYVSNRYTDDNVYWLAVAGDFSGPAARMQQVNGTPGGTPVAEIDSYRHWVHAEQDNMIGTEADDHIWDFYNWYWTDETSVTVSMSTPGAVETDSAYIYTSARTGYSFNGSISISVNGVAATVVDGSCHSSGCQHTTNSLLGGAGTINHLDLTLKPLTSTVPPFLNYIDISYHRYLRPANNRLDFGVDDTDGEVEFKVEDNFTSVPTVFDISDPLHPIIISGFRREGGYLTFRTAATLDGPNRYLCDVIGQAVSPVRIDVAPFTDLRADLVQSDLLVITAARLEPYLDEYIAYRGGQGWATRTVLVEDIMDNFSYGLYDPTAIRDFLKFAYENYPEPVPATALFVGDATYDYHDNLGTGMQNYVPSYIRDNDLRYSDDNYVYFGDDGILDYDYDRGFDMMTARWPVRSAAEINTIVNKIRSYESSDNYGDWRTRVTLVADDEHTNRSESEYFHFTDTEKLEKGYVPRLFNREKIYLWDYPIVNGEKPDVNSAIVKAFNDGSLVVNYVGHGNPDVWSHEHVLQRSADLPRMTNEARLPLVYAASCDIGFFDDPTSEGMAEDLLSMSTGGAIGVISATRLVYAADNAQFNRAVYDKLLGAGDLTICEAMFAAKVERQYPNPLDTLPRPIDNDRAYNFLGDPCLRLGFPRLRLEFSERPDSLVPAGVSRVSGRVVDEYGLPVSASGELQVSVYDSDREMDYYLAALDTTYTYYVTGPPIFRGSASINDGYFTFQFVTPLDVAYRGASARVSTYARLGQTDGIGVIDSIKVSQAQSSVTDFDGPLIEFSVPGRQNLVDGTLLNRDESLQVRLTDPSGLNLVGGVGHGIMLILDDELEEALNLTDLFQYDRDDYTSGGLTLSLAGISPGSHRFKIKAWDNVNNVSTVAFTAEIATDDRLVVRELLNYPNPMHEMTTFYFDLSQAVQELRLAVYTLSGKNIWNTYRYSLEADSYPNGAVDIIWDGRDSEGDRVANGVYVYRLTARADATGESIQKYGKIIVLN